MSAFIDPDTVATYDARLRGMSARDAVALQKSAGRFQPEVVGFVIASVADLRPDAASLGLYTMVAVLEMFRAGGSQVVKKVRESTILRHWAANRSSLGEARGAAAPLSALLTTWADSSEPAVVSFIAETLSGEDDEDPVTLTAEESWHLMAVLKTVVDALHDACRA